MKAAVEYLIILPKGDSFCDSIETFNKLLQVDSAITLKNGVIKHRNGVSCRYEITSGDVAVKEQRFFHLRFTMDATRSLSDLQIDRFSACLKTIRSIIAKAGGLPEVLWDDVSLYYSKKAYVLVHEIENLMRKLITNFMLVTVGKEWVTETSPNEIQEALSKSKRKDYLNVLHTIDFIHLADFLVRPYSKKQTQDLYAKLRAANKTADLDDLRQFIPESNWSRYFSKLVDCEDSFLSKRWTELYELRCKVAHNAIVTKTDFEQIERTVGELQAILEEAIKKLPQVSVPANEVETVAENAAGTIHSLYGEYITVWTSILGHLQQKCRDLKLFEGRSHSVPPIAMLDALASASVLEPETAKRINVHRMIRNDIVHNPSAAVSATDLERFLSELKAIRTSLGIE